MWRGIGQIFSKWLLLGMLLAIALLGAGSLMPESAFAEIRQMEEAPGELLYQSRHSLRDRAGYSWQVVLFKNVKAGQVTSVSLRLVGFPGVVEFSHPQPLQIKISSGDSFTAEDLFAEASPAANVGQYDLKAVLLKLPTDRQVLLSVAMADDRILELPVPPPVVLEWQSIANL